MDAGWMVGTGFPKEGWGGDRKVEEGTGGESLVRDFPSYPQEGGNGLE